MKLKYTQAKKARRASSFQKHILSGTQSRKRREIRLNLQPPRIFRKTFGEQIVRVQRVPTNKTDQFGNPRYKFVLHAAAA